VVTTLTLEANRDTVINNNIYTVLNAIDDEHCRIFIDVKIVRDFAGKIYKYIPNTGFEVLLNDYSNLGTYDIEYPLNKSLVFHAQVIFNSMGFDESFDGIDLEIQYTKIIGNNSYDNDHPYKYIKDIGVKHV
jgi:hypothetical protein